MRWLFLSSILDYVAVQTTDHEGWSIGMWDVLLKGVGEVFAAISNDPDRLLDKADFNDVEAIVGGKHYAANNARFITKAKVKWVPEYGRETNPVTGAYERTIMRQDIANALDAYQLLVGVHTTSESIGLYRDESDKRYFALGALYVAANDRPFVAIKWGNRSNVFVMDDLDDARLWAGDHLTVPEFLKAFPDNSDREGNPAP